MTLRRSALATALFAVFGLAQAADHRDGPLATGDPTADINDVYPFINPNNPNELIVAITVLPVATPATRFSDAVEYRLHLDNGAAGGTTTITCTFPNDATRVLCRNVGDTLYAEGPLETIIDRDDLRVYAGLRDDPFFFDLDAFNRTRAMVSPQFTNPGVNFFRGLNTQVIVLGIEHARLTNNGANPRLKVYSSTNRIGDIGISGGITGLWFDATNPGHGLVLQVSPGSSASSHRMVAYWNVFDSTGAQLNIWGIGDVPANSTSVTVPVSTSTGGRFPPASSSGAVQQAFGSLAFTFSNCNTGSMQVTPTRAGFGATTVPLTRLTNTVDAPCSFLQSGQIDRMGRPGINTALIDLLASTGKKDQYNRAVEPSGWAAAFQSEMQANLTALDTLDGVVGNYLLPPATLAAVLVDDRLIIDTSKPNCDAYLAVETGSTTQCGGRTLSRDVIDDTLGAVVGPGVSDNVPNDTTFLTDFPFLAPPN